MDDKTEATGSRGRRRVLKAGASVVAWSVLGASPGAVWAQSLIRTPTQSMGPFYPRRLPADADNDLVQVAGQRGTARGIVTHLGGRVLDEDGRAISGALIEIWQCDANGRYHHPGDRRNAPLDEGFQGYGRDTSTATGEYRFRTIKPVAYPGRAPHVHFAIRGPGFDPLITQMYVAGAPENRRDWLLNRVHDRRARERLIVAFSPDPAEPGALRAQFDIVLGRG